MLLSAGIASAQKLVTGRVLDANGEPVIGAAVRVVGGKGAVATDANGNFTVNIEKYDEDLTAGTEVLVATKVAPKIRHTVTENTTVSIPGYEKVWEISKKVLTSHQTCGTIKTVKGR